MTPDEQGPTSRDLHDIVQEALARRPSVWRRLVAWLRARVTGREGTLGGYWGGVTMWDRVKAAAVRATAFLRR